jgi:1-acyl-sn-glycerol-3-phosphate acyltransferase
MSILKLIVLCFTADRSGSNPMLWFALVLVLLIVCWVLNSDKRCRRAVSIIVALSREGVGR